MDKKMKLGYGYAFKEDFVCYWAYDLPLQWTR